MPRSWRFIVGLGVAASLTPALAMAFGVDPRVERTVADGYLAGSQQPVACNAAGCLAVWSVFSADHMRTVSIRAARIGPTGALLEPSTVTLSEGSTSRYSPSVATDGTNFFVVWVLEGTGVVGARVSGSGAVLDAGGVVLAPPATGSQQNPTVAWNGHDYLAVWQEAPAGVSAIRGTRVSAGGVVRDPAGLAIGPLSASTRRMPTVVGVGDGFVVAWEDARVMPYGDLYLARVAADGTVRDPAGVHPFTAFHTRTSPALSSDGSRALLVWQDGDGGLNGVQSALLGVDGLAGAVQSERPEVAASRLGMSHLAPFVLGANGVEPDMERAALGLSEGQWSGAIRTRVGWAVLRVIGRVEGTEPTPDALRALVRRALESRKLQAAQQETLAALRSAARIEMLVDL